MEKPSITPICCGQDAEWIVQSLNLAYFFCRECRKEVIAPEKLELKEEGSGPRVFMGASEYVEAMKAIYGAYDIPESEGINSGVALREGLSSGVCRYVGSDEHTAKLLEDVAKLGTGLVKVNWDSECKGETIRPYEWWYGKSAVADNIFLSTPIAPDDGEYSSEIVEHGSFAGSNTRYAFTETYTLVEHAGDFWGLIGKENTINESRSVRGDRAFMLDILYCLDEKALLDWLTNLPTKKNNTEAL